MKLSTSTKYLLIIFLVSFILFSPSLKVFYTNDDFFHLSIANASSAKEFINFFNLAKAPEGWGLYRPLTTQVFYFITVKFFHLNPIPLHIISFVVFFGVIYLVYLLVKELFLNLKSKFINQVALLAIFLYATSATHFGHLYFLGAFQELGMAFFFLLSVISFIKFLQGRKFIMYFVSLITFLLALLSKETAVVLPFLLLVIYWYIKTINKTALSFGKMLVSLAPYFFFLLVYFYFRIAHYGFAQGDSYIWDFSLGRVFNTLGWYGLWSFNLPEMLVDFVGPGLRFNPNLFKFWSHEVIPIFILFGIELLLLFYLILKSKFLNLKSLIHNQYSIIWFSLAWFVLTLVPVLFLPLHKFTFYLTLPLIGVVVFVCYLLISHKYKILNLLFLGSWLVLSILTLNLTRQTHWITRGSQTARNVHYYLTQNSQDLDRIKTIVFYDTEEDKDLPWSPSGVLKVVLSDQNYFKVFWNDKFTAKYYTSVGETEQTIKLKARNYLGY